MVKNRIVKIKGYYYSFDKKGRLQKNRSVSKNGYTYYANKQGRLITGWRTSKGYSYYYDRNRRMVKDRIVKIGGYYSILPTKKAALSPAGSPLTKNASISIKKGKRSRASRP